MNFLFCMSFLVFGFFLQAFAKQNSNKPTVIIQAICWDRFTSKNITYFPWGNHNEANATSISMNIGFSIPCQPFAYYGKSPVKFFSYETNSIFQEQKDESEPKLKELGEFNFDATEGVVAEYFLLLFDQKNKESVKFYPLSLSQDLLPYGKLNCYSQYKENLYLAYGEQKHILAPGKSVRFNKISDSNSLPQLKIFTLKDRKYAEIMTEHVKLRNDRRAIIFFSTYKMLPLLKSYYFKRTPLEYSIGYNSLPLIMAEDSNSDDNTSE